MTGPVEILLVEDSPSDIELTLHALTRYNITSRVETVRDGAEALEFLFCTGAYAQRGGGVPKVILLDLKLPKLEGREVLRQVRANPQTRHIPVVVLTSSRDDFDIVKCYELGANSYLVKPVDFDKFAEAIGQVGLYWLLLNQQPT